MTQIVFPHCDPRVLHAPGECEYCDQSGLQPVREAWGIAFTGRAEEGKLPCPGETARGLESLNKWSGNRAKPTIESVAEHIQRKNRAEAAVQLMGLLKDLSEELYAASWLFDWEFIVWDDIHDNPQDPNHRLDPAVRARLMELSDMAGGWVCMPEDLAAFEPQFIEMGPWIDRLMKRSEVMAHGAAHKRGS